MPASTKTALLDVAQQLAQTRGFNAFSFQDLARSVGIRTASVHHHFPTKADLGRELMARYRMGFLSELRTIAARGGTARKKVEGFADLFRQTLRAGNRLCLCGMLATEFATLSPSVQREVRTFYDETEGWLAHVLRQGSDDGTLELQSTPVEVARTFLATLEGAMIAARTFRDERRLDRASKWLLASIDRSGRRGAPR